MEIPTDKYELVVGLEVHMQLLTRSKAYSSDANEYGQMPNTLVSPISLGHPGTLPLLNRQSVKYAMMLGHACHMDIHRHTWFARKNYFYADLPKGYQITQDKTPICTGGFLMIKDDSGNEKRIGLTRAHLEEDAGKSLHDQDPFDTLIDLNRAGVPLIELVSEPDLRSAKEAYNYLTEVRKLVRYLGICDGNMEEGSLRCDANVSVRLIGDSKFNTRCEIKNMNSIRNVQRAIEFEFERQVACVEKGETILQETRGFDAPSGTTFPMRTKELAHDYRYFPEPDMQPVRLTEKDIEQAKSLMPALPSALYRKYTEEFGLSDYDAMMLTNEKEFAMWYEVLVQHTTNYKAACNWLIGPVKAWLNENATELDAFAATPEQIAGIIRLVDEGKVSASTAAEKILPALASGNGASASEVAAQLNLIQDAGTDEIMAAAEEVIRAWPDKVAAYKGGNKGLLGLFMGEFMKKTKGKANPKTASQIIQELLDKQ
ncbi:MAG: Asp-tRNA(Asn)/Glu-tRNA(Gln) amidotransferase subunit GatB [Flavobacteriales bacterium]|nr:Asp-tRNA(Asn)/Glu-tRNA(Gln) amidotransferase subunit GatB [Flavobacteriales bacterium]